MGRIRNVHERILPRPAAKVGPLLDGLSSAGDRLWPGGAWPPMRFDAPLGVGARGGHGPIRYEVERYEPGRSVRFRFRAPRGFRGFHGFEVLERRNGSCVLRHTLEMDVVGSARLSWPLVYRPLHDALLEDVLARAQAQLGLTPEVRRWSLWVRGLRAALSRGRAGAQEVPEIR